MGSKPNSKTRSQRSKSERVSLPKPKAKFEIYLCRRSSPEYLMVFVHQDYKSLQRYRQSASKKDGGCEAFFRAADFTEVLKVCKCGETRTVNNCFGEVHFYPGSLTFGIIAHEMYHAVTSWGWEHGCLPTGNEKEGRKSTVFDIPTNEELCAELMGELVGQTMVGLMRTLGAKFLIAESKS